MHCNIEVPHSSFQPTIIEKRHSCIGLWSNQSTGRFFLGFGDCLFLFRLRHPLFRFLIVKCNNFHHENKGAMIVNSQCHRCLDPAYIKAMLISVLLNLSSTMDFIPLMLAAAWLLSHVLPPAAHPTNAGSQGFSQTLYLGFTDDLPTNASLIQNTQKMWTMIHFLVI